MLVLTPETVPPLLGAVVAKDQFILERKITETGAHVDVHLRAQFMEQICYPRVFLEGLNKRTDGVLDRIAHLRFELRKTTWFETVVNPRFIEFKVEVRTPDEKVARPETVEGFEPTRRPAEIPFEGSDVG